MRGNDFRTADEAERVVLERCQIRNNEPCVLFALDDTVRPPAAGKDWPRRDMERVHYAGPYRADRVPALSDARRAEPDIVGYGSRAGHSGDGDPSFGPGFRREEGGEPDGSRGGGIAPVRARSGSRWLVRPLLSLCFRQPGRAGGASRAKPRAEAAKPPPLAPAARRPETPPSLPGSAAAPASTGSGSPPETSPDVARADLARRMTEAMPFVPRPPAA